MAKGETSVEMVPANQAYLRFAGEHIVIVTCHICYTTSLPSITRVFHSQLNGLGI